MIMVVKKMKRNTNLGNLNMKPSGHKLQRKNGLVFLEFENKKYFLSPKSLRDFVLLSKTSICLWERKN